MKGIVLFAAAAQIVLAQTVPSLSNARAETRAFAGNLDSGLRSETPAWFGYEIKSVNRDDGCCCSSVGHECSLEDDHRPGTATRSNGPVHLEGSTSAAVLFRVANNHIEKIRLFSISCPLDAGGLRFVWLTGVPAHASLSELHLLADSRATDALADGAVFAIAQHDDPEADSILSELSAVNQPERLREKAAFWLGASRGASGVRVLQQMLKNDPNDGVRDKVIFALSISKQPEATDILIRAAKTDSSAHVRGQAIFWLAQKAGKQAEATIVNAIQNDPDSEVKKKAVFALSQLPREDGVPKLIEVARTQKNPEVRKQAFFWLGQSGDPRALAFIEQTLTNSPSQ
jgi:hypothetical protein